jgi:hypothetical protein
MVLVQLGLCDFSNSSNMPHPPASRRRVEQRHRSVAAYRAAPVFSLAHPSVSKPIVVRFTSREREPDRQTAAVNHYMYLAGVTSSRPAHGLSLLRAMQAAC